MGRFTLNSRFTFLAALCFCLLFPSAHIFAQEGQTSSASNPSSWRDWLGFQVALSVHDISIPLKASEAFSQGEVASPQLGERVQLGLVFDRQSKDPIVLSFGLAKAQNLDKKTKDTLKGATLLDIGIEYPVWSLLNKKKHQLRFDVGAFGSMCHIAYLNAKGLSKWGASGRFSLAYDYKLQKDFFVGCKLYNSFGRYFGKSTNTHDLQFSYVNELGLSVCVTF